MLIKIRITIEMIQVAIPQVILAPNSPEGLPNWGPHIILAFKNKVRTQIRRQLSAPSVTSTEGWRWPRGLQTRTWLPELRFMQRIDENR